MLVLYINNGTGPLKHATRPSLAKIDTDRMMPTTNKCLRMIKAQEYQFIVIWRLEKSRSMIVNSGESLLPN